MNFDQTDKNFQYTREKHSDTYGANFFIDNTFLLSTRGTGPVPRALVGHPQTVVSRGGDHSGAASIVPLDASTAMVGMPCPLAVSSLISSSTVPLLCLGFGELLIRIKKKGEFQSQTPKRKQEKYWECNDKHSP
jgi:hypothetical protein